MSRMKSLLEASDPVLFFYNGIGDHIINLPALRAAARAFAGRLTLVCSEGAQNFLLDDIPARRRVKIPLWFGADNRRRNFDDEAVAAQVGNCDLFVSLVPWTSDSLTSLLNRLRPETSVGFFPWFDVPLPRDFSKHSADLAFDVVRRIAPEYVLEDFAAPPPLPAEGRRVADELRGMLAPGARVLAVHTDTKAEKMWGAGRFTSVLDMFLERHPDFVAFVVGGDPQRVDDGAHADRVIPCHDMSLLYSCCVVATADLFLGVDSCMLHVADFARVPGVGLFGHTRAEEFGFRVGPNVTIQAEERTQEIEVEQVYLALESLLADPRQSSTWPATRTAACHPAGV